MVANGFGVGGKAALQFLALSGVRKVTSPALTFVFGIFHIDSPDFYNLVSQIAEM